MRKSTRIFLGLSAALLVSDLLFVAINYRADSMALQQSLEERGSDHRSAYQLTYHATLNSMLQMATLISHDQRVQQLFLAGKRAVEAEGGGPGGERAAHFRKLLQEEVGPSWRRMTEKFDARQLHFHLGPGSVSFLRVHRPERYGDRMDDLRHIIVDSYANRSSITGFETGRVYSGLRGVVPMYATDPDTGDRIHTGTLEVGTSFSEMFATLDQQLDIGVAAMLKSEHVAGAMWQQFISPQFEFTHLGCDCKVEATSRPVVRILDATLAHGQKMSDQHTHLISVDGHHYAATHFALFDYKAQQDNGTEPVGAILVWSDAHGEVAAYRHKLRQNLTYAITGFLMIELLLWLAVRYITHRLEREIELRTDEAHRLNELLLQLSATDELTGLATRRHLLTTLDEEISRARRHSLPLTLLMFDLDHFKKINDRHGHLVGDEVLRQVGELVRGIKRNCDLAGRYGGEEFCLVLPHTNAEGGRIIAERLRESMARQSFHNAAGASFNATLSIGVAVIEPGMSADDAVAAADVALYAAKRAGRNRVAFAAPDPGGTGTGTRT